MTVKPRETRAYQQFAALVERDPRLAYEVYSELESLIREAEYPRLTVGEAEDEDGEKFPILLDEDGNAIETIVSVDIGLRHTESDGLDASDFDNKEVHFDYSGNHMDAEGFVYLVDDLPYRLPEGWTEA